MPESSLQNVKKPRRGFLERLGLIFGGGLLAMAGSERSIARESRRAFAASPTALGYDPFIGEIALFGFNFAPVGWATCSGQLLSIAQNTALFSLLGTTYGGDGQTTFGLPDLRGRVPIHFGQGPGLSNYDLGEQGGTETVTLTTNEMPSHNHSVVGSSAIANSHSPDGAVPAANAEGIHQYNTTTNVTMNSSMIQGRGGSQAHENRPPFLGMNFCIATEGIYPSRP